jgi:hypothetical protein
MRHVYLRTQLHPISLALLVLVSFCGVGVIHLAFNLVESHFWSAAIALPIGAAIGYGYGLILLARARPHLRRYRESESLGALNLE